MAGETTSSHSKAPSHSGGRQDHQGNGQGRPRPAGAGKPQQSRPQQGGRPGAPRPQSQTRSGQGQQRPSKPQQSSKPAQTSSNPNAISYIDANGERRNKVVVNQPKESDGFDKGKKNKQVRTKESTRRQAMLNTHRINPFKYDMNQILAESTMDPSKASAFLASVIAKASRTSTRDAKDFVKTFVDAGDLSKDEADKIGRLLDKYSRYR